MVSGLPDRPLSVLELEALVAADATGFVIPATSESLRDSGHGGSQVYDVLISVDDTVSAVVYDEEGGGRFSRNSTQTALRKRQSLRLSSAEDTILRTKKQCWILSIICTRCWTKSTNK